MDKFDFWKYKRKSGQIWFFSLADDNFVKLIQQHKTPRRPGFIADIVDGSVYRKVLHDNAKDSCETKADFNLTFTMNTGKFKDLWSTQEKLQRTFFIRC